VNLKRNFNLTNADIKKALIPIINDEPSVIVHKFFEETLMPTLQGTIYTNEEFLHNLGVSKAIEEQFAKIQCTLVAVTKSWCRKELGIDILVTVFEINLSRRSRSRFDKMDRIIDYAINLEGN
jgi:hypothetical protein